MLKATAGGGGRGIRKVTTDAELADAYERTRDEAQRAFGSGVVFLEKLVTGRPARRGAGHRRRPGLGVGDRRARLLGAAPQPEGHRGVGLARARRRAGRRAQGVGRAARHRGRVRRRRHRRVPLPPARPLLRLPRGQHPPAGRAPDHRGGHRHRPGAAADPRGVRRAARRPTDPTRSGTPSRRGSTPRTPTATSPRRRAASSTSSCRPAPASASTPVWQRATRSPPTSTR